MIRSFLITLVGAVFLQFAMPALSKVEDFPSVSILLPANVRSETVQIAYQLRGPFGGYSMYTEPRRDLRAYAIPASVEGKAATEIRTIVYATGCEIQTFVITLAEDSRVQQEFICEPVRSVTLSGFVPNQLVSAGNAELRITYSAYWAHQFFSIADGPVVEFKLATLRPDANGAFQVDLPCFRTHSDGSAVGQQASLSLALADAKTWNRLSPNLIPEEVQLRAEEHNLRIQTYYTSGLKFVPDPSWVRP